MASTVQTRAVCLRRGDHSASLNFAGLLGEVSMDTGSTGDGTDATTTSLRFHNGITSGGIEVMRADCMNISTRVLAEGRQKIGDKNLAYADLGNLADTPDTENTSRVIRENIIQVLNASTVWTDTSLLLATKKNVTDEVASAKQWVKTNFVAEKNPGGEYAKTSNNITLDTTFNANSTFKQAVRVNSSDGSIELIPATSTTTGGLIDFHYAGSSSDYTSRIMESASGRLSYYGSDRFTETNSTSSDVIATKGWVNDATKSTNVVHRSGTETVTGAKTFTGTVNMTGANLTVATLAEGTSTTGAASTAFVTTAVSNLAQTLVTLNTEQTITGTKHFNTATILYADPEDPEDPYASPIASEAYVKHSLDSFGEDIVITTSISDVNPLAPTLIPSQEIYADKTFTANNSTEINKKIAAIPADDPDRAAKIAALQALAHTNTTTFNSKITSTGANTWSGSNTFSGAITAANITSSGTVALNGTTTAVTPAVTDSSTKVATTAFVTNYAMKIQPVVSKFADAPNGAVTLQYNTKLYRITGTVSSFSFNTSQLGTLANDEALEFKIFIPSTTNASSATWPASVNFLNDQAPTLAAGRNYVGTMFSIDKGATWWLAMEGWNYALWG